MAGTATPGACLITFCVFRLLSFGCSRNTELLRHRFLHQPARASALHLDGSNNTAKVEVYYEALCPDSLKFLNSSLREVWEDAEFRARMSLHLYPFGNGQLLPEKEVSQGYHFWHPDAQYPLVLCQHGERECLGNKIQACALADLQASKHMAFLLCMVSYGPSAGPELTSHACGTRLGVDMAALRVCATSRRGHDLVVAHGKRSLNAQLNRTYVPWIMVNGKHSKAAENDNLIEAICGALDVPKPVACSNRTLSVSSHNSNGTQKKGCGHGGSGSL